MLRLHNNSSEQGITLLEVLITVVLIGILAAMGIPNLLNLFYQAKVRESATKLQNVPQDAQKQAIQRSQSCNVTLAKVSGSTSLYYDRLRVEPMGCLTAVSNSLETISGTNYHSVILPAGVKFMSNISATPVQIKYSYQGYIVGYSGLVSSAVKPTLVVFRVDEASDTPLLSSKDTKKCLMASSMLSLVRAGNYSASNASELAATSITSNNCTPGTDGSQ